LIIEHEQKRLQQIENLDIPVKEAPEVAYTEADATFIKFAAEKNTYKDLTQTHKELLLKIYK